MFYGKPASPCAVCVREGTKIMGEFFGKAQSLLKFYSELLKDVDLGLLT